MSAVSFHTWDNQSLRGQAHIRQRCVPTSHEITLSRHDVLEASHTRRASPLLAGLFPEVALKVGQFLFITRQGISLP
jgi:hypothetical protein